MEYKNEKQNYCCGLHFLVSSDTLYFCTLTQEYEIDLLLDSHMHEKHILICYCISIKIKLELGHDLLKI